MIIRTTNMMDSNTTNTIDNHPTLCSQIELNCSDYHTTNTTTTTNNTTHNNICTQLGLTLPNPLISHSLHQYTTSIGNSFPLFINENNLNRNTDDLSRLTNVSTASDLYYYYYLNKGEDYSRDIVASTSDFTRLHNQPISSKFCSPNLHHTNQNDAYSSSSYKTDNTNNSFIMGLSNHHRYLTGFIHDENNNESQSFKHKDDIKQTGSVYNDSTSSASSMTSSDTTFIPFFDPIVWNSTHWKHITATTNAQNSCHPNPVITDSFLYKQMIGINDQLMHKPSGMHVTYPMVVSTLNSNVFNSQSANYLNKHAQTLNDCNTSSGNANRLSLLPSLLTDSVNTTPTIINKSIHDEPTNEYGNHLSDLTLTQFYNNNYHVNNSFKKFYPNNNNNNEQTIENTTHNHYNTTITNRFDSSTVNLSNINDYHENFNVNFSVAKAMNPVLNDTQGELNIEKALNKIGGSHLF
ncbi:unnamed protein product [Schistosoma turkestanicum]|nr:unnamed protein product [Schistosoma turkestanicum]